MAYRFQRDESVEQGARRIACEQIDRALESVDAPGTQRDEAIHDIRKRCKKIRALLRLVREAIGSDVYSAENAHYRDAARLLSDARDGAVMVETVEGLSQQFAGRLSPEAFAGVRDALAERHRAALDAVDEGDAMAAVADALRAGRERVETWPIFEEGFDALAGGLRRVYKRGLKGLGDNEVEQRVTMESMHEWRKRVKYLWYHLRLLRDAWQPVTKSLADQQHALASCLGEYHDLAVLRDTLTGVDPPDEAELPMCAALIEQRLEELLAASRDSGRRLYALSPGAFVGEMTTWWQAWREPPVETG
jgi:CHAD domain-containing protein